MVIAPQRAAAAAMRLRRLWVTAQMPAGTLNTVYRAAKARPERRPSSMSVSSNSCRTGSSRMLINCWSRKLNADRVARRISR
jgi:hypothetical protein